MEMSREKIVKSRHIWVEILNEMCCSEDEVGNRPCDWGCPCNRCNEWYVLHEYAVRLKEAGLDYSFYAKYL